MCAYRSANVPRMRPAQRFLWPKLNKMVNRHRRLEDRPLFKVGSTYVSQLLPCLQPGEWTEVPINTTMPADYTALVFVREPIRRFVSGLSEVIRRTFLGQCPSGPCTADGVRADAGRLGSRRQPWQERPLTPPAAVVCVCLDRLESVLHTGSQQ